MKTRFLVTLTLSVAVLTAIVVFLFLGKPNGPEDFAQEIAFAPGYKWNVISAGYEVCGELERGTTPEDIIKTGILFGINGDLYTSDSVKRIVALAPLRLCPDVRG